MLEANIGVCLERFSNSSSDHIRQAAQEVYHGTACVRPSLRSGRGSDHAGGRGAALIITYFAYGSNMAPAVMSQLCPQHRYLGPAKLTGYRLTFTRRSRKTATGVADVVASADDQVWGTVYEIAESDLQPIDRKEGFNWAYTKVILTVTLDADGSERTAMMYTVVSKEPTEIAPSRAYLNGIIAAARTRGLPDDYVTRLATIRTAEDDQGKPER